MRVKKRKLYDVFGRKVIFFQVLDKVQYVEWEWLRVVKYCFRRDFLNVKL